MTPDQLMVPRYKVVADYPASPYNVGDILIFWEIIQGYDKSERPITTDLLDDLGCEVYRMTDEEEFKKYPHLFKPLQWWEERPLNDLPNYVNIDGVVYRVDKWENYFGIHPVCFSDNDEGRKDNFLKIDHYFKKDLMVPATEQEYLTYINSKK